MNSAVDLYFLLVFVPRFLLPYECELERAVMAYFSRRHQESDINAAGHHPETKALRIPFTPSVSYVLCEEEICVEKTK